MSENTGVTMGTWKNLPVLNVKNESAEAVIALHGAHVLSYKPAGERDLLWLSEKSWAEADQPIRGGIPVCWPWFGSAGDPKHGVARLYNWTLKDAVCKPGSTKLIFEPFQWNDLTASVAVTVADKLVVELTTENRGKADFRLSEALHSYFAVSDISKIEISGLDRAEFIDTLNSTRHIQEGVIRIGAETDRIYDHTPAECVISDPAFAKKIHIRKDGSMSTVVWNPWIAKSKMMPDFGDDEYTGMVCVETTNAANDTRTLAPGKKHTLTTILFLA